MRPKIASHQTIWEKPLPGNGKHWASSFCNSNTMSSLNHNYLLQCTFTVASYVRLCLRLYQMSIFEWRYSTCEVRLEVPTYSILSHHNLVPLSSRVTQHANASSHDARRSLASAGAPSIWAQRTEPMAAASAHTDFFTSFRWDVFGF